MYIDTYGTCKMSGMLSIVGKAGANPPGVYAHAQFLMVISVMLSFESCCSGTAEHLLALYLGL